jgi:hypothetical protein
MIPITNINNLSINKYDFLSLLLVISQEHDFFGTRHFIFGKKINYPLLLFFIAVKMGYVFSMNRAFISK